jgi:hypothetical protein
MWIGTPQTGDKLTVGYYYFLSLPLRLIGGTSTLFQYKFCRLISLLIFLSTIFLAWKIAELIFSRDHPLRWMVPLFLATLPGFIDIMLSVSNDVAAVFSYSFFLVASIRLFVRQKTPISILSFLVSLLCCAFAKNVTWVAILLAPLVILLCLVPRRFHQYLTGALAAALLILLFAAVDFRGPSDWFMQKSSGAQSREFVPNAPEGSYVLSDTVTPPVFHGVMGQCITPDAFVALQRQKITYGSWIWANEDAQITAPIVRFFDGRSTVDSNAAVIAVKQTPQFFSFVIEVPELAHRACVLIGTQGKGDKGNTIYYDGFVLAKGSFSGTPPQFVSPGSFIVWDGNRVANLMLNSSFEQMGARIKPWVEGLAQKVPIVSGRLSFTLSTLFFPHSFGWFYENSAVMMFRTFWADIAGNKVILPGRYTYQVIFLVFIAGVFGSILSLARNFSKIRLDIGLLLLSSMALIIGANLVQSAAPLLESDAMSSFARHNYPIIVPIAIVLCLGWWELFHRFGSLLNLDKTRGASIYLTFLFGMLMASVISSLSYFHPMLLDGGLIALAFIFLWGLCQIIYGVMAKR